MFAFTSACLAVGFLTYLNRHLQHAHIRMWKVAWMFYAVYLAASIQLLDLSGTGFLTFTRYASLGISALFLSWGNWEAGKRHRSMSELAVGIVFVLIWACMMCRQQSGGLATNAAFFVLLAIACVHSGVVYVGCRGKTRGAKILGTGFILWGLHLLVNPFLEPLSIWFAGAYLISALLAALIIFGMILDQGDAVADRLYSDVIESANEAIFLLDCGSLTILETNPAVQILTGLSRADLVGKRFSEACPALAQQCSELPEKAGTFGASFQPCREFDAVGPNGKRFVCESTSTIVYRRSGPLLQVSVRDISERKHLEAELLHAQKMEAVGRLAGGVAHDFNNILTAILGHAELLMENSSADEVTRKGVGEIRTAAERAASLTRQLLAFSRKQILEPMVFCPNDVVAKAAAMLQRLIGEDVNLEMRLDGGCGRVKSDPGQIEQVIMNLAVNARDAMPHGGKLFIETANVMLSPDCDMSRPEVPSGDYVMLAVTDTGEGISKEVQARLFEPFFTTKPNGKGTGLGLATCHGIVKQSGGHIAVHSEPGHGTTFKVYLPRVHEQVVAARRQSQSPKESRGTETLLLVEDEPVVRDLACLVLRKQGYKVLEAEDGLQALELVESGHADHLDLLVTDLVMPEIGGKELADRLHAKHPDLKVLFCSGYTHDAIVESGVQDEKAAFLQKPYASTALALKVREVIDCLNS